MGIDVGAHIARDLGAIFGERFAGGNIGVLKDMVDAGFLGMYLTLPSRMCIRACRELVA